MKRAFGSESGLSLAEVLVAFTLLAVTITAALVLYDDTRRSIKRGENQIDQQQVVRIAFDELNGDLRLAGYNHNPDGLTSRPDEQIEAAFDTAVAIRADFDGDDPVASLVPEDDLDGGAFDVVSTGNDEIRLYVLAKPGGGAGSDDTLVFAADVSEPRDGTVETISVPGVALVQDDPPYTLYRVTFNNDPTTFGTPDFIVRTPLADNIERMSFQYFDRAGLSINPTFDLSVTTDDIGGAEDALPLRRRAAIRRVGVEVVGRMRDADVSLDRAGMGLSLAELEPQRERRRFRLTGDVVPRNAGMRGMADLFALGTPPGTPESLDVVPGHCKGLMVTWDPRPATDDIDHYRVFWGEDANDPIEQFPTATTDYYLDGLEHDHDYYVSVQAIDRRGTPSLVSSEQFVRTSELTTPRSPATVNASLGLDERIEIDWSPVVENDDSLSGDPDPYRLRDHRGYAVYRTESSGAPLGPGDLLDDTLDVGDLLYVDESMVHCQDYYYRVRAVDHCGVESDDSVEVTGQSTTTTVPAAPLNVEAYFYPFGQIRVTWQAVLENVDADPISIDRYRIYRTNMMPDGQQPTDGDFTFLTEVSVPAGDPGEYIDNFAVLAGQTAWYRVTAVDRCPNESDPSSPAEPSCWSFADVWFENPQHEAVLTTATTVHIRATPFAGPYESVTLDFENLVTGTLTSFDLGAPTGWPPAWYFNDWSWVTEFDAHRITATLYKSPECTMSRSIDVYPDEDDLD